RGGTSPAVHVPAASVAVADVSEESPANTLGETESGRSSSGSPGSGGEQPDESGPPGAFRRSAMAELTAIASASGDEDFIYRRR
ncbi:MAG TPA: hypothetical protein VN636_05670, partial [Acidimicrobiia bacterium]|nr:hypothetical protein [Acidimicrobiia bacterium]